MAKLYKAEIATLKGPVAFQFYMRDRLELLKMMQDFILSNPDTYQDIKISSYMPEVRVMGFVDQSGRYKPVEKVKKNAKSPTQKDESL